MPKTLKDSISQKSGGVNTKTKRLDRSRGSHAESIAKELTSETDNLSETSSALFPLPSKSSTGKELLTPTKKDNNQIKSTPKTTPKKLQTPPPKSYVSAVTKSILAENDENDPITSNAAVGSPSGFHQSSIVIDDRVKQAYKLISKSNAGLGGNGYDGAIYGELTMHSMQKVINTLVQKCGMTHSSRFIDVGSGLGKPNFHAAQDPAVRVSIGVELEDIRWKLAIHNLNHMIPSMEDNNAAAKAANAKKILSNVNFICSDIDIAKTLDPFTHIYMFDLGFPPPLQQSIARKFNDSVHCHTLISYRPPHRVIHEYGYAVESVCQLPTSMFGSGESHTAYFYRRVNVPAAIPADDADPRLLHIPARPSHPDETDINVVCDDMFRDAIALAVAPTMEPLKAAVTAIAKANMNSARPVRQRKPRILASA